MNTYYVSYAGHHVYYSFVNDSARFRFKNYIHRSDQQDYYDIRVTSKQIEEGRNYLPPDSDAAYVEYRLLIPITSRFLLRYHCCIFHAVSFVYKDYAWLLTAPSGTGKTTQYMNWLKQFPDEIKMICGDMPVLELTDTGKLSVHASPWNGKEKIGNQISCMLGGIILLEQSSENKISKLSTSEGLIPLFNQFLLIPENKDDISALSSILNCIFSSYPVLKFKNDGSFSSTRILRESIDNILENTHEI